MLLEGLSLTALADGVGFSDQLGDIRQSLLSLGLLLIVAKLAEGVFRRLHLNSILAYASAGILLGPVLQALTGWSVQPTGHIDLLLTLGIFIFFFLIGLDEIDISSFVATLRGHYFLAAIVSVLFSLGASILVTSGTVLPLGMTRPRANLARVVERYRPAPGDDPLFRGGPGPGGDSLHEQPGHCGQGPGRRGAAAGTRWTADIHRGGDCRVAHPPGDRVQHRGTHPRVVGGWDTYPGLEDCSLRGLGLGPVVPGASPRGGPAPAGDPGAPAFSGAASGHPVPGGGRRRTHGLARFSERSPLRSFPFRADLPGALGYDAGAAERRRRVLCTPVLRLRRSLFQLYLCDHALVDHGGPRPDPAAGQFPGGIPGSLPVAVDGALRGGFGAGWGRG